MRGYQGSVALCVAAVLLLGSATAARAQSQGPLLLMPIAGRTLVAPEVKITDINGATGTLIGAYAGHETDHRLFLGGAGYWLADPRDTTRLFYVGFLAGWQVVNAPRFHVGVRGLAGLGEATVYADAPYPVPYYGYGHGGRVGMVGPRMGWRDSLFVAEPEIRAELDLTDRVRIGLGLGYRITSAGGWFGDRLEGATGSVGVQIGLGK